MLDASTQAHVAAVITAYQHRNHAGSCSSPTIRPS